MFLPFLAKNIRLRHFKRIYIHIHIKKKIDNRHCQRSNSTAELLSKNISNITALDTRLFLVPRTVLKKRYCIQKRIVVRIFEFMDRS